MDINQIAEQAISLSLVYAPKLVLSLLTLYVGFKLANLLVKIMDKGLKRQKVDPSLSGFLESLVGISLKAMVLITVAGMIGIEITSLIAVLGAAGFAIGLSLQGSLSNLAGGILILLFKPFKVHDVIEIEGRIGAVHKIMIFSTILITPDNKTVTIPNGNLSNDVIINYTTQKQLRADLIYGIGYDDDIKKAKEVLLKIAKENALVIKDIKPEVMVANLGDSSVDLLCRVWVKSADYPAIGASMHEKVKLAFDEAKISMPYPQRDVHLTKA